MTSAPLRIGYVPEHFSTPLHFAQKYFGLKAELIPFPSGTGHMSTALREREIDIGIGLTEGWVAALAKEAEPESLPFQLVGTYVESPLCWAINVGAERDMDCLDQLQGSRVGVSRLGSGSHVMSSVLAQSKGWEPFATPPVILGNFAQLREGVNIAAFGDSPRAQVSPDFFMWEYFTSKKYYGPEAGDDAIKKVGEIYTPWPSWQIVAAPDLIHSVHSPSVNGVDGDRVPMHDGRLALFLSALQSGIKHFNAHHDEAVKYISTELDYSAEDARQWIAAGVRFGENLPHQGVSREMIFKVLQTLETAGVLTVPKGAEGDNLVKSMIGIGGK